MYVNASIPAIESHLSGTQQDHKKPRIPKRCMERQCQNSACCAPQKKPGGWWVKSSRREVTIMPYWISPPPLKVFDVLKCSMQQTYTYIAGSQPFYSQNGTETISYEENISHRSVALITELWNASVDWADFLRMLDIPLP